LSNRKDRLIKGTQKLNIKGETVFIGIDPRDGSIKEIQEFKYPDFSKKKP